MRLSLKERLLAIDRGDVEEATAFVASNADNDEQRLVSAALYARDPCLAAAPDDVSLIGANVALAARLSLVACASFEFDRAQAILGLAPSSIETELALAGLALLAEDASDTNARLEALSDPVRASQDAYLTVSLAVWRAIASLREDAITEARVLARRASRMARTEAFPQLEYFANIVLARVRRLDGTPHLAARILHALSRVTNAHWRAWVSWELAWVDRGASLAEMFAAPTTTAEHACRALGALFESVERDEATDVAFDALNASTLPVMLRDELGAYRDGLLGASTPFGRGLSHRVPLGLDARAATEEAETAALVLVEPDATVRVFASSPRARAELPLGGTKGRARLDTAVSVFAFAGAEGLPVAEAFEAIYGFTYLPETHGPTFRVLVHHLRKRLEEVATIEREDERLTMRVTRAFAVRDPRSIDSVANRLLRLIAERPFGAKQVAALLDVPLRTAQAVLGELVESGSCVRDRKGNAVTYRVEDTTFSEPTTSGLVSRKT